MISVIIPVYNVYPFLAECIDSVCNQTYADLEIILVDDGSTDQCGVLCDNYAQKDARISVIHQQNMGLSGARNTGIIESHGDYLVFVDSDDRIHPMMLQILYDAMLQYHAEIVICSHRIIQEQEPAKTAYTEVHIEPENVKIMSGRECVERLYSDEAVDMVVAWNKLYPRSVFSDLKYPLKRLHEDEFITHKILYPLTKCIYINVPLYEYRLRANSIMAEKNRYRLQDKMDAFEERCIFFEKHNDTELYHKALRRYETSIAEFILYLKENHLNDTLMRTLNDRFHAVYKEQIAPSGMAIRHKFKFILFMKNNALYKVLKNMVDRFDKNAQCFRY